MKVKKRDLDPDQVARMKGIYGMTDEQIMRAAQGIVDPSELVTNSTPSRRGRRFTQSRK